MLTTWDSAKQRGKGAPKKKRTAAGEFEVLWVLQGRFADWTYRIEEIQQEEAVIVGCVIYCGQLYCTDA